MVLFFFAQGCVWGIWCKLSRVSPSPLGSPGSLWVQPTRGWVGEGSREEGSVWKAPLPGSPSLPGSLPKPSLHALPSSLVPLDKPVTIQCRGPPGVDLYRLEKLRSGKYEDQATLVISAMKESLAGQYRCSYQKGTRWSPPSDQLELIAIGTWKCGGGGCTRGLGAPGRPKRGMVPGVLNYLG